MEFFDRQLNGGSNFFFTRLLTSLSIDWTLFFPPSPLFFVPSPPEALRSKHERLRPREFFLFCFFSFPPLPLDVPFHRRLIRRPRREEPTNCHEQCNAWPIDDSFSSANLPNARSFPSFFPLPLSPPQFSRIRGWNSSRFPSLAG